MFFVKVGIRAAYIECMKIERTLAGFVKIGNRVLSHIKTVTPSHSASGVRKAVQGTNPLVLDLRGKVVRKWVTSRTFPRVQYPHPYTLTLNWPEEDDKITVKALRAMASDWNISGRSKAKNKTQLRNLIRNWRNGK